MITELRGISSREALAVDLHEGGGDQLPLRAVRYETLVQVQDGVLIIAGVHRGEVNICLGQPVLAALVPHDDDYHCSVLQLPYD